MSLVDLLRPRLTKYIPHTPFKQQQAFLLLPCREAFYGGAAGGGKSDALLMAALQYVDIPGYNAVLFRDTYQNLSKPEALMDRSFEWLMNTDAHWRGDNKQWVFPSGATLSFSYLEGPRDHFNHQSAAYQYVGMDEIVAMREHQAMYLHTRMRKLEGRYDIDVPMRYRAASNPPAREQLGTGAWVKRRYVDAATRHKGIVYIPAKMQDNKYLDSNDYTLSFEYVDKITAQQLRDGDWNVRAQGNIFSRDWFHVLDKPMLDRDLTVRYWDKAATEPQSKKVKRSGSVDPDYTVGVKITRTSRGMYVIEDVVRFRLNPGDTETLMRRVAEMDGKSVQIVEEEEGGSAGKTVIANNMKYVFAGFAYKGVNHHTSKYARALPFSTMSEGDNVYIYKGPWTSFPDYADKVERCTLDDFFDELELFPDGEHDDIVDSASGAFDQVALAPRANIRVIDHDDDYVDEDREYYPGYHTGLGRGIGR